MRLLSERDESPAERLRRARERWLALCDAGVTLPDYLPRPERLRVERRLRAKRVVAALFLQCMRLTWAERARRGELLQFPFPRRQAG